MKKFLSIVFAILMLFSLMGCNDKNPTLDDAKKILDDNQVLYTDDNGEIHAWIGLYIGYKYEYKSLIEELEKTFDTPSYDELLKLCDVPNKSVETECGNIKIKIQSLPTKDNSKIISIHFEETVS